MYCKNSLPYILLAIGLSGCNVMSPSPHMSTIETPPPPVQNFSVGMDADGNRLLPDISQFQPGSYCRLEYVPKKHNSENATATAENNTTREIRPLARIVAGRIVAIDETNIVLGDAISISSRPGSKMGVPVTTNILNNVIYGPWTPRLFKFSGTGRETIAIPGEVTIERANIRDLQPVDGSQWTHVLNSGQWFERVGLSIEVEPVPDESRK